MRLVQKHFVFFVLAGCSVFLVAGCRGGVSSQPPIHLNPNMDNQTRFDPQEQNTFFKDKRAMRLLVKGTVARGHLRGDDHLYRGKVGDKFASTLPSSIKLTKAFIRRGQERYNIYCSACHGFSGNGKGVVTLYSEGYSPANLLDDARKTMAAGKIYSTIANGKINNGLIAMPPHKSQLSVSDRWAVVAYVRALQLATHSGGKKEGNK